MHFRVAAQANLSQHKYTYIDIGWRKTMAACMPAEVRGAHFPKATSLQCRLAEKTILHSPRRATAPAAARPETAAPGARADYCFVHNVKHTLR